MPDSPGSEPSSPHQSERGFPLDRTFEIVHLPTSKVLGLSTTNHENVELQRAGRLLPHQRWVYDKDHGIWNPFSGRALVMSQVGDAAFVTTLDLTAEQDLRAPSWVHDATNGLLLLEDGRGGGPSRRLTAPEQAVVRRGSFDGGSGPVRRGSFDAVTSRLGLTPAFTAPTVETRLSLAPHSGGSDGFVPEAARWQLRGDPYGGFPNDSTPDFEMRHAHSFFCLGLNSSGTLVLHPADHDQVPWRWMYDRTSQALCVADSKGLCVCLEVVVEAASTSMLTFRRSSGGVRLQTARPDPARHWQQRWVYDPSTRLVLHPATLAALDTGTSPPRSGKSVKAVLLVPQMRDRTRIALAGPGPVSEPVRSQEMIIDPGVPLLSREEACEAGLVLREGDVRGHDRVLGSGSGGEVRVAFHRGLRVALKTAKSSEARSREVWALHRLAHHPGIVQGLGVLWPEAAATPAALLFVCVDGLSLAEYAVARGPLLLVEVVEVGVQVAMALDYVHSRGLVHGDLHCGNILVDRRSGGVRLLDFGLSRCLGDYNRARAMLDVRNLASVLYRLSSGQLSEPGYHPWKLVESDPLETVARLEAVRHACLTRVIMGCFGWGGAEPYTALDVVMALSQAREAIVAQEELKTSALAGGPPVRVGSYMRFLHLTTARALSSRPGEACGSSGLQLVYAGPWDEWHEQPHDLQWQVELANGPTALPPFVPSDQLRLCSGDVVRLRHRSTGRLLGCPAGHKTAVTGVQEVAAVGEGGNEGVGEWRVEVVEESSMQGPGVGVGSWRGGANVWLTHTRTGGRLRSQYGRYVRCDAQQEVGVAPPQHTSAEAVGRDPLDEAADVWRADVMLTRPGATASALA